MRLPESCPVRSTRRQRTTRQRRPKWSGPFKHSLRRSLPVTTALLTRRASSKPSETQPNSARTLASPRASGKRNQCKAAASSARSKPQALPRGLGFTAETKVQMHLPSNGSSKKTPYWNVARINSFLVCLLFAVLVRL